MDLLKKENVDAWVGGIRLAEGNFYWYDVENDYGERVELDRVEESFWATDHGQPDNYKHQENCISLNRMNDYQWNDAGWLHVRLSCCV